MLPQGFNYFNDTPVDFTTGYDAPTFNFEGLMLNRLMEPTGGDSPVSSSGDKGPVKKTDMQYLIDFLESERDPKRLEDKLRMNLAFEKERMAQAAPYKLAFEIPQALGGAFFKPALMELAGAGKYAQIMDAGIARMPNMVPGAIGIGSIPQRNYFG
jgi:hypothetical protein